MTLSSGTQGGRFDSTSHRKRKVQMGREQEVGRQFTYGRCFTDFTLVLLV